MHKGSQRTEKAILYDVHSRQIKMQIQGANLQVKKIYSEISNTKDAQKWGQGFISFLPSFHMCRKSVSVTDTPGPDDYHSEIYLIFCNIPLWQRIGEKKNKQRLSEYVTSDLGGCTLPTSTKLKINYNPATHLVILKKEEKELLVYALQYRR